MKDILVSFDGGKNYVEPTAENAKAGKYPIVRPLYYSYEVKSEAKINAFLKYVLSPAGQKVVETIGYLPIK